MSNQTHCLYAIAQNKLPCRPSSEQVHVVDAFWLQINMLWQSQAKLDTTVAGVSWIHRFPIQRCISVTLGSGAIKTASYIQDVIKTPFDLGHHCPVKKATDLDCFWMSKADGVMITLILIQLTVDLWSLNLMNDRQKKKNRRVVTQQRQHYHGKQDAAWVPQNVQSHTSSGTQPNSSKAV